MVKVMGGLGNQMFQYAAARRLALARGSALKLDLSFYLDGVQAGDHLRSFQLCHLNIAAEPASREEVAGFCARARQPSKIAALELVRKLRRGAPGPRLHVERHFHFDPAVLRLSDDCYLDGYWQSEKYFAEVQEAIRAEFAPREPLTGKSLELAETIRSVNAVSVHVRRGDYVSAPAISAMHGSCSLDYYQGAVARLATALPAPHFFIFSDDPDWVREHLKLPYAMTLVAHNGPDEVCQDLRLMSLCRHHIIANSSLSWWGAWLSGHPGKSVIAPKRWFNDPSKRTGDLLPAGWIRL